MKPRINVCYIKDELAFDDFSHRNCQPVDNFGHQNWRQAENVSLSKYWSGDTAPTERWASARLLWTDAALFVRFDCQQHEPFVINHDPQIEFEAEKLWERDVCELFLAPDQDKPQNYFEFEVAPTGEWLDFAILHRDGRRETDTSYNSGIKTATQISENAYGVIFRVEWQAFGKKPRMGDQWLGNLFRCVGSGASRGYLAWQPTLTDVPNFHVPQFFGVFKFIAKETSN